MRDLLDWFRLEELPSIVILAVILTFTGGQMAAGYAGVERRAAWCSASAFLLYAGAAINAWGIADATQAAYIAIRSLLASAVAYGIGTIIFAIAFALRDYTEKWRLAQKPEPRDEPPKELVFEKESVPEEKEPPPPPPPTREQLAKQALMKYEERLSVIENSKLDDVAIKAAREQAQQQYTQDLDQVIR